MTPACMTPEEIKLYGRGRPCFDCPWWFAVEMRLQNCCNGTPGRTVKAGMTARRTHNPTPYATAEERLEARRASWRESKRRKRQAA